MTISFSVKFYKDIFLIITLLIFSGCISRQDRHQKFSEVYLSDLAIKLSGKRFQIVSENFEKGKTLAFLLDKENWVVSDSIISSELKKSNILAEDSTHLKTVTLIYSPALWKQIYQDSENNLTYKICFVDLNSFTIKKMIEVSPKESNPESRNSISQAIIQEFNH